MIIHLKKSLFAAAVCLLSASSFASESQSPAWMERLWAWADEFDIPAEELPRNKKELLAMTELKIDRCDDCAGNYPYKSNPKITYLPPEIGQLSNLEELYLYGNQLQFLPAEIGQLSNLQELWLEFNQIQSLPIEVGQLNHLKYFSVSRNKLQFLPAEIGQLSNLQYLFLYENQLQSLPQSFIHLNNLNTLWIHNNPQLKLTYEQEQFIRGIKTVQR